MTFKKTKMLVIKPLINCCFSHIMSFFFLLIRSLLPPFRRLTPISRVFGYDRGKPIDRYYIESFLKQYSDDIRGRVLEIGEPEYTRKFGGEKVIRSDVLHAVPGNPSATIVGDIVTGVCLEKESFDCIILTQTLLCIFDLKSAIQIIYESLRPEGVVLVTIPGISQISRYDMERWGDYWRFTNASVERLFGDVFGDENLNVYTYGNVFSACSLLYGLSAHELKKSDLDYHDPDYQVLIAIRAKKRGCNSV